MKDGRLKDILRALLRRAGYTIAPYNHMFDPDLRRASLLARLGTTVVLDVGANVGQYGGTLRRHGYSGKLISFEPIPAAAQALRRRAAHDPSWEVREVAITDQDGIADFHVAKISEVSSLLVSTLDDWRSTQVVRVQTQRLESFIREERLEKNAYLKLDIQGSESRAISGCGAAISSITAIELEMSCRPFYEGEALVGEMAYRLERLGYWLVSVDPFSISGRTGYLQQLNAIFLRNDILREGA